MLARWNIQSKCIRQPSHPTVTTSGRCPGSSARQRDGSEQSIDRSEMWQSPHACTRNPVWDSATERIGRRCHDDSSRKLPGWSLRVLRPRWTPAAASSNLDTAPAAARRATTGAWQLCRRRGNFDTFLVLGNGCFSVTVRSDAAALWLQPAKFATWCVSGPAIRHSQNALSSQDLQHLSGFVRQKLGLPQSHLADTVQRCVSFCSSCQCSRASWSAPSIAWGGWRRETLLACQPVAAGAARNAVRIRTIPVLRVPMASAATVSATARF